MSFLFHACESNEMNMISGHCEFMWSMAYYLSTLTSVVFCASLLNSKAGGSGGDSSIVFNFTLDFTYKNKTLNNDIKITFKFTLLHTFKWMVTSVDNFLPVKSSDKSQIVKLNKMQLVIQLHEAFKYYENSFASTYKVKSKVHTKEYRIPPSLVFRWDYGYASTSCDNLCFITLFQDSILIQHVMQKISATVWTALSTHYYN